MSLKFILKQIKYHMCHFRYHFRKNKYPTTFMIETVLGCNLQCPECGVGGGYITREGGCMSFDRFKIVADKIKPYAKYIYLHIWGEPLLNKDIIKILEYASKICRTNISTNGMLVTEEVADKLITSGVSDIIVSIDGFSQEIYEKYRRGGKVVQALEALTLLVESNNKHGRPARIYPQYVVFKHNQPEMKEFEEYCKKLGVLPVFKAPYIRNGSVFENSNIEEYIRKPFRSKEEYEKAILKCPDFTKTFNIALNGDVFLCCYDANTQITFGNIFNKSVHEICFSQSRQQLLKRIREENKIIDFCRENCLNYVFSEDADLNS